MSMSVAQEEEHVYYLLCAWEVDDMDFKTEKMVKKTCGCDTFNVVERGDRRYLKCTGCGKEMEI